MSDINEVRFLDYLFMDNISNNIKMEQSKKILEWVIILVSSSTLINNFQSDEGFLDDILRFELREVMLWGKIFFLIVLALDRSDKIEVILSFCIPVYFLI